MRNWIRTIVALGVLAWGVAVTHPAAAASIAVNTAADELNADGDCSLREAIRSANSDGVDPHDACAAGSGADTITLPAGTYPLAQGPAGDDAALTGDLDVTSAVTLDPTGTVVIDGALLDRAFHVLAGGSLTAAELTVRRGSGAEGGGILNAGTLSLSAVTISENQATGAGGGIASSGTATLVNSTVSGNKANGHGGGLEEGGGSITLNNVTLVENTADAEANDSGDGGGVHMSSGTLTMANTILADGTDRSSPASLRHPDCSATITSQGYNLIEDPTGCTVGGVATGNVIGTDPRLGGLANNGGPTFTHEPRKNSPAIDAGNPAAPGSPGACAGTDQRGVPRPQGPRCDIGSVEVAGPPAPPPRCLGRNVTIEGTAAGDSITGTNKADVVLAKEGNDVVFTGRQGDAICAGPGNDLVNAGSEDDVVAGQSGRDRLIGGPRNDLLRGQGGRDRLKGKGGVDQLRGGVRADLLVGGSGFDVCDGGPGRDQFRSCERRI